MSLNDPYTPPSWNPPYRVPVYPNQRPIPGMPPGGAPSYDPTTAIPTTAVVKEAGISILPLPRWAHQETCRLDALPVDGEWTVTAAYGEQTALVGRCADREEAMELLLEVYRALPPEPAAWVAVEHPGYFEDGSTGGSST